MTDGRKTPEPDAVPFVKSSLVERSCLVMAIIASAWVLLVGLWEIGGTFTNGHYAMSAARSIMADNFRQFGLAGPVRVYTATSPGPAEYYCNHPWGTYWIEAFFGLVFGRSEWVSRLPPVLWNTACIPLLFAVTRRLWGPVAAATAATTHATIPIYLAFLQVPLFESFTLFACLGTWWAFERFERTRNRRWLLACCLFALTLANSDWHGYIFAGVVLGSVAVTGFFLPSRWFQTGETRRLAQLWCAVSSILVLTLVAYVKAFRDAGHLATMLDQANLRSSGSEAPLADVLSARAYWIESAFTSFGVALGLGGLAFLLVRPFVVRRMSEFFPLGIAIMTGVHYFGFKQGADVHIYWPLPFGTVIALSAGSIVASLHRVAVRAAEGRWSSKLIRRGAAPLLFIVAVLPCLAMLPDAVRGLAFARHTGGRFNDDGHRTLQGRDKAAALAFFKLRLDAEAAESISVHNSLHFTWADAYYLARPTRSVSNLRVIPRKHAARSSAHRWVVLDSRFASAKELIAATQGYVTTVGPFWLVDWGTAPSVEAYSLRNQQPNAWQWFWQAGTDPQFEVRQDDYLAWELRDHFGQFPNPEPKDEQRSREQLRISHNIAVASNRMEQAASLRRELERGWEPRDDVYSDGTRIIGTRFEDGVVPTLIVYFLASGPAKHDYRFEVTARVKERPVGSFVRADDKDKKAGVPCYLPPKLWKPGYIYSSVSLIRKRPGRELYFGHWRGRSHPKLRAGSATPLLTLPR